MENINESLGYILPPPPPPFRMLPYFIPNEILNAAQIKDLTAQRLLLLQKIAEAEMNFYKEAIEILGKKV